MRHLAAYPSKHSMSAGATSPGSPSCCTPQLTALEALPESDARFTAVPPRIAGFGTFPVRAFARM
ncbi:hypothetical protein QMG61_06450 [Cryobacterium sp. PH31-AA6]|uniref:hypothetical protein n=1 Tax=Cryobacterium sp. PH31-AA6 TaxID=3046205 RepID=UPI0024B8D9B2|nr:hypothetical protein [Cryobacterium sp. PH31-AA6]MDJ0323402.1 hypothetical protein [Cryobacterium sp. PH31-AA6]